MFIKREPNEQGNYGNPSSTRRAGMVTLPDYLTKAYIDTMGFAFLEFEEDTVTSVTINQEAYDAYQESLPEPEPEPEPMTHAEVEEMLLDQEYRLLLLEYGLEEEEPI